MYVIVFNARKEWPTVHSMDGKILLSDEEMAITFYKESDALDFISNHKLKFFVMFHKED